MSEDWLIDHGAEVELAQRFLREHRTLHDLLTAGGEVLNVVVQDEYTHDIVARLPWEAGALLVVFDCT